MCSIVFEIDEASSVNREFIKQISDEYPRKKKKIAEFMLQNGLREAYGDMSVDEVVNKLGRPTINPGICQITYSEHTFDAEHIISVEYTGILEKFYYFSIDG